MLQTLPILAEMVHKNRVKPADGTLRKDSYMAPCPALKVRFVTTCHYTSSYSKRRKAIIIARQREVKPGAGIS